MIPTRNQNQIRSKKVTLKKTSQTNHKRTKIKNHNLLKINSHPTKLTRTSRKEANPLNRVNNRSRRNPAKTKAIAKTHPTSRAIPRKTIRHRKNRTPSKILKILSRLNVRSSPTRKVSPQMNRRMLPLQQKKTKKANSPLRATSLRSMRQMLMTKPSPTIKPTPSPDMTTPIAR